MGLIVNELEPIYDYLPTYLFKPKNFKTTASSRLKPIKSRDGPNRSGRPSRHTFWNGWD